MAKQPNAPKASTVSKASAKAKEAPKAATVPAPKAAPKATTPKAPLTPDLALEVAKAYTALVVNVENSSATFVANARFVAKALATPMTYAQWDEQVHPFVKGDLVSSGLELSPARVSEYCSRFKVIALACLTGDEALAPQPGESRDAYLKRVREPLDLYRFPDGTPMMAPSVTGKASSKRGRKAGTKASNAKAPTSAATVESGNNANAPTPAKSAALNLMGGNADAAERLLVILKDHREAFDKWSADLLALNAPKVEAKPKATFKAPKPAAPSEPVSKLAEQLAVLTAAKPPVKTNGASA